MLWFSAYMFVMNLRQMNMLNIAQIYNVQPVYV